METSFSTRLEQFLSSGGRDELIADATRRIGPEHAEDLVSDAILDVLENPGNLNGYSPRGVVLKRMQQLRHKAYTTTKRRRSDQKVVRVGLDPWSQEEADCKPDIIWNDDIAVFFHNGQPDSGRRVSPRKPLHEYESPTS